MQPGTEEPRNKASANKENPPTERDDLQDVEHLKRIAPPPLQPKRLGLLG